MCELFDQYTRRGMQEGIEKGRQEGIKEGIRKGICENITKSVEAVMKNLGLDLQKACTGLGISVEEYIHAKEQVGAAARVAELLSD